MILIWLLTRYFDALGPNLVLCKGSNPDWDNKLISTTKANEVRSFFGCGCGDDTAKTEEKKTNMQVKPRGRGGRGLRSRRMSILQRVTEQNLRFVTNYSIIACTRFSSDTNRHASSSSNRGKQQNDISGQQNDQNNDEKSDNAVKMGVFLFLLDKKKDGNGYQPQVVSVTNRDRRYYVSKFRQSDNNIVEWPSGHICCTCPLTGDELGEATGLSDVMNETKTNMSNTIVNHHNFAGSTALENTALNSTFNNPGKNSDKMSHHSDYGVLAFQQVFIEHETVSKTDKSGGRGLNVKGLKAKLSKSIAKSKSKIRLVVQVMPVVFSLTAYSRIQCGSFGELIKDAAMVRIKKFSVFF